MIDVDATVALYLKARDAVKSIENRHKEELAGPKKVQEILTGRLIEHMNQTNTTQLKSAHGTCYTSVRYTASLADADAFMKHVISTQDFDLLDRRANSTAVQAYIKKNNIQPPGCNLSAHRTVGVRKKGSTPEIGDTDGE